MTEEDALAVLTPQEREAYLLAMTDRSHSSIGVQMGLRPKEVAALVRSAVAKMVKAMRPRTGEKTDG